ncbi:FG-GAP-like repeat-containing protein [Candidatus Pyrohabitans sp.]
MLRNGYYVNTIKLLENLREYYPDVGAGDLDSPEYMKALVIPTGGLYGLDSDEIFKAKLEKFVAEGGVLIVFAQQRGYEYRALPGGELSGYGWAEDISCTWGTVEISHHHPAFAGQSSLRVGANIDGYFTSWPENARILMTKRDTRWPVMIEYRYGRGRVVATTMYSDWAFANGQAARSEVALVRDLLAWAKSPEVLPEYAPGDIARIPVNVTNRGNVSAREVVFTLVNPEKSILANVSMDLSLAPGESRSVEFEYLLPEETGIYWVDYALVDASGNVTQVTYESARFAVSSIGYLYRDRVLVEPQAESYVRGSVARFNITIENSRDVPREVEVAYGFVHNLPRFTENPQRINVTLPAKGNYTIPVAYEVTNGAYSGWFGGYRDVLRVRVYENYTTVGGRDSWITVYPPALSVYVETDRSWYDRLENVTISVTVRNLRNARLDSAELNVTVVNPLGEVVLRRNLSLSFSRAEAKSEVFNYTMPQMPVPGRYMVEVETPVLVNGYTYSTATPRTSFEFPLSMAVENITIPVLKIGNNTIAFDLNNIGRVAVRNATLSAELLDSGNALVWYGEEIFDIVVNGTRAVNLTASISELKFGAYWLRYNLSYGGNTSGVIFIPNRNTLMLSLEKPGYRVREAVNLNVATFNTGRFLQELNLTLAMPELNLSYSLPLNLTPGESYVWNLSVPLPVEAEPGYYEVVATAALRGGSSVTKVAPFHIPESRLSFALAESNLSAGGSVVLNLSNTGGVDAGYALAVRLFGPYGKVLAEAGYEGTLRAGSTVLHALAIPSGAVNGSYVLHAFLKNLRTNESTALEEVLWIRGLNASIDSVTDKPAYFLDEAPLINTSVVNLDGAIENATLNLKIVRAGVPGAGESWPMFRHDVQRSGSTRAIGEMRSAAVKWSFNVGGPIYSSPAIADVDGDGKAEVVFTTWMGIYVLNHNGSILWNTSLCNFISSPVIADVDRDSRMEIVTHGCAGVYVIDALNGTLKWFSVALFGAASTAVADLEGDGKLEVVAQGNDALYVLSGEDGSQRWNNSNIGGFLYQAAPALADIDGDGELEIIAVSNFRQPRIYVLKNNGSLLWNHSFAGQILISTPAVVDIDGDEMLEVVFGTAKGVYAFNHDGTPLWNLRIRTTSSPAVADVDGDGEVEVVIGGVEAGLPETGLGSDIILSIDGAIGMVEWSFPTLGEVISSPAIADIDGDGRAEVIVMDAGGSKRSAETVYAINGEDGSALWSLPIFGVSSPAIADVDSDGMVEVVVGSEDGMLYLLDYAEEIPPGGVVWEKNLTVSIAESAEFLSRAGAMNFTGKYYLISSLYSNTSQLITKNLDSFYVVGKRLYTTLETDKRLYKPGEEVNISGEVVNLAAISAENMTLIIKRDGEPIYEESFPLAPNETRGYSISIIAGESFTLEASVDGTAVAQLVEVKKPNVNAELFAPESVSDESFNVSILLENIGEVDADLIISIENRSRTLLLPAGHATQVTEQLTINRSTTIDVLISGDVSAHLQKDVLYLSKNASVKVVAAKVYQEGMVEVPFYVVNTGEVPLDLQVNFTLSNVSTTRLLHLPVNTSGNASVAFNLPAGEHLLRYSTPFEEGGLLLKVAEPESISLNVSHSAEARGVLHLNTSVLNSGAYPFHGELRMSTRFYSQSFALNLSPLKERLLALSIPVRHVPAGNHSLRVEVLRGGKVVESYDGEFAVPPAVREVLSVALDRGSYSAGENLTLSIAVRNAGGTGEEFNLTAELPGVAQASTLAWVEPMEEKNLTLSILLPEDLPAGEYVLTWRLHNASGELPFSVVGANISVGVVLNRTGYLPNESVLATFRVENLAPRALTGAWLRARLGEAEETVRFNLSAGEQRNITITFTAPERSDRLFYGIYQESGRALLLGAVQVRVRSEAIFLRPERDLYRPGENVTLLAEFSRPGRVVLRSPFIVLEENVTAGERNYTFNLPLNLSTGSYSVEYEFTSGNFTELGSVAFDVLGYSTRILEARLSGATFSPGEEGTLVLEVENNGALPIDGNLSGYAFDGAYALASIASAPLTLTPGERKEVSLNFTAGDVSGVGVMVYAINTRTACDTCAPLTLMSAVEFFHIAGGAVLQVGTSKTAYVEGEALEVLAEVFSAPGETLIVEVYNATGERVFFSSRELNYSGLGMERFIFTGAAKGTYRVAAAIGGSRVEQVFYVMPAPYAPPSFVSVKYPTLVGDYMQFELRSMVSGDIAGVHLHLENLTLSMNLTDGYATACVGPFEPGELNLSLHAFGAGGEAWNNFSLAVARGEVKIKAKAEKAEEDEKHSKNRHMHRKRGDIKFELEAKWKKGRAKGEFVLKEKGNKPIKGKIDTLYRDCDGAFYIAGDAWVKHRKKSEVPFNGSIHQNEVRLWISGVEYAIPTRTKIKEKPAR